MWTAKVAHRTLHVALGPMFVWRAEQGVVLALSHKSHVTKRMAVEAFLISECWGMGMGMAWSECNAWRVGPSAERSCLLACRDDTFGSPKSLWMCVVAIRCKE